MPSIELKQRPLGSNFMHSNVKEGAEMAEIARRDLQEARAEAEEAREQAAVASLGLERSQLQADQDTLALQRQAASSAEEQLERCACAFM